MKRSPHAPPPFLDEASFAQAVRYLANRDRHLSAVVKTYGPPPLWIREPGFPTLVYIILEQQVSLASARAAFERLKAAANPLTPGRFLKLTDGELHRIGFSRQKTLYTRLLAESLARRYFDLRDLDELHDDSARKMLIAFKGIGRWTADIYLLSALRRPDIWPTGDLALASAVQGVKRLRRRPSPEKLEALSAPWRPWRAVAARLFWHAYLSERGQKSTRVSLQSHPECEGGAKKRPESASPKLFDGRRRSRPVLHQRARPILIAIDDGVRAEICKCLNR